MRTFPDPRRARPPRHDANLRPPLGHESGRRGQAGLSGCAGSLSTSPAADAAMRALAARCGSPLLVVDCARLRLAYRTLAAALPDVDLHYAVKALPLPEVVANLAGEGAGFDLATTGEAKLVVAQGVPAERCLHTHPAKRDRDIREALEFGVTTFVADSLEEVGKFVPYRRQVELLLRIAFRSPDAVCDLSRKFGCDPGAAIGLHAEASRMRIRVRGLCFHVGSQPRDPAMHVEAIRTCAALMFEVERLRLPVLDLLDIGGGFPVAYREAVMPIDRFCRPIRGALTELPANVRVIAEPGRFLAAPAATSVATVMGRARREGRWWYYLDDGLYGSYSGQLFDHARYPLRAMRSGAETFPSVLAGPTCDSIDVIDDDIRLPLLEVGDLIVGSMMGAYTLASATDFNFFRRATVVVLDDGHARS